jgi:two-component system, NarL family, nitrate/nitrite response regulator NarL
MPSTISFQYGAGRAANRAPMPVRSVSGARPIATLLLGSAGLSRDGLVRILDAHGYAVLDGFETVADLDPACDPALVLLSDFGAAQVADGTIGLLRSMFPQARIVVLTDMGDPTTFRAALKTGAQACLDRVTGPDALIKSLNVVMRGNIVMPMHAVPHLGGDGVQAVRLSVQTAGAEMPPGARALSNREIEILTCLADGQSNKLIARRFAIAEATVKIHVKGILRKINVQNRTQAAVWVLKHGIPRLPGRPIAQ